ncbi:MAG: M35 family metallo-endopeptidase [Luteimonas sp.]
MKTALIAALAFAAASTAFVSDAIAAAPAIANPLRVSMAPSQGRIDSFLGAVDVVVTNIASTTVRLPKWQLPLSNGEGQVFSITRDGVPVRYIGRLVKWGVPGAADFAILRPGQAYRATVDLSASYDLSRPGQYVVTFVKPLQYASLSGGVRLKTNSGAPMLLQSAPMPLWKDSLTIAPSLIHGQSAPSPAFAVVTSRIDAPALPDSTAILSRHTSDVPMPGLEPNPRCIPGIRGICDPPVQATTLNCTVQREDLIKQAITAARGYTENTKQYLLSDKQGDRYTWWFGTYLSDRYVTAQQNFTKIDAAMDQNGGQISVNCACDPQYQSAYAYVDPSQPYKIYVCNAFWAAATTGTDSKAGTLIHEMSHFTVVADTNDWVYGQTGAHNLALSNPNRTSGNNAANVVGNADSQEYFSENTPTRN